MKTIMKIALFLSAIAFAASANAQTVGLTPAANGPDATAISTTQDSAVVDFVTVGSTMPYRTVTNSVDGWFAGASTDWGFTPTITQRVRWSIGGGDFAVADNRDTIFVTWPTTPGQHTLTVENAILQDGTPICTPSAISTKNVFVLPRPIIDATVAVTGHNAVLCSDYTAHHVIFQGRGIGQLDVTFTVERRNADGVDTPWTNADDVTVGTARNVASWFETTTFATALAQYDAGNNQDIRIDLSGLTAGFMYRVSINGISDQISRKSFTGDDVYTEVTNVFATFAIVPETTTTRIDHVSNTP